MVLQYTINTYKHIQTTTIYNNIQTHTNHNIQHQLQYTHHIPHTQSITIYKPTNSVAIKLIILFIIQFTKQTIITNTITNYKSTNSGAV